MGKEIERKFLVKGEAWKALAAGTVYRQGYLSTVKERTVRVRTVGEKGFLTIKGVTTGVTRAEFEYEVPAADANAMLDGLCEKPLVEKTRTQSESGTARWVPTGSASLRVALISAFSVKGRRAMSASPPTSSGVAKPAAASLPR